MPTVIDKRSDKRFAVMLNFSVSSNEAAEADKLQAHMDELRNTLRLAATLNSETMLDALNRMCNESATFARARDIRKDYLSRKAGK